MRGIERKHLLTGAVIITAALVAIALTWYALGGSSIALRHEPYVNEATAIRAVFCPARVQDYVSRFTPGQVRAVTGLAKLNTAYRRLGNYDWLNYLPLEFTFLFAQTSPLALEATLFVQEHPNGPAFAPVLNPSPFFRFLRAFEWLPPQLAKDDKGYLVAAGRVHVPPPTQEYVGVQWPAFSPLETNAPSGQSLFELVADNTNGVLTELQGALEAAHPASGGLQALRPLHKLWPLIEKLHFTADLVEDDHIAMRAEVTLPAHATTEQRQAAVDSLEAAAYAMAAHVQQAHGFQLHATANATTTGAEAAVHLRGFQALLERAL
jgi:hypothetical protein